MQLLHKPRKIVLGRRQSLEQFLLLLGKIVDRRLGQLLAGLDHLLLLFEELFQLIAQLIEFLPGVVGQITAGAFFHLGQQIGLRAPGKVQQPPKHVDDPVLSDRQLLMMFSGRRNVGLDVASIRRTGGC